jgi:multisubunit Na+/H+ antiporter MnhE subunit
MTRWFLSIPLLALVYALALGSFDAWDLLLGAALAGALLWRFRRFLFAGRAVPPGEALNRALACLPFAGVVIREAILGTWDVALRALRLRPLGRPGIVEIPIEDRTPNGVAVSALTSTLSPGAVLVDVDWKRRVMLFHVIDASDPRAIQADHQRLYSQYQRRVFP